MYTPNYIAIHCLNWSLGGVPYPGEVSSLERCPPEMIYVGRGR